MDFKSYLEDFLVQFLEDGNPFHHLGGGRLILVLCCDIVAHARWGD